jgi:hypothetical protein
VNLRLWFDCDTALVVCCVAFGNIFGFVALAGWKFHLEWRFFWALALAQHFVESQERMPLVRSTELL